MKFGKKRNKLIATLLSATVAVSIVGGMFAAPATSKFSDVPSNHWATSYINKMSEGGLIKGYGNGKYGPEDKLTIGQMAKLPQAERILDKGYEILYLTDDLDEFVTQLLVQYDGKLFKSINAEDALPESAGPDAYDGLPLREAVSRLPEELRQVVILRFFADRTLAETAECLGLPVGTVSTRQRKALQLLRLDLGEEENV